MHSIELKNGVHSKMTGSESTWLRKNMQGSWHYFGVAGKFYIGMEKDEDKCLFILRYVDHIA